MDWIDLAQDMERRRAFGNEGGGSEKCGKFFD
jgi:hypothetical protein